MISTEDAVGLALDVARDGLSAKEMPIGAVIVIGDEVSARKHTKEREFGRRVVHADLLAILEADKILGFQRHAEPAECVPGPPN